MSCESKYGLVPLTCNVNIKRGAFRMTLEQPSTLILVTRIASEC
jgi:hypothetical protein